jgi:hypothetical protein
MRAASPRAAATKPVRQIAEREGVSVGSVVNVQKRQHSKFERTPSASAAERDAKLRAVGSASASRQRQRGLSRVRHGAAACHKPERRSRRGLRQVASS